MKTEMIHLFLTSYSTELIERFKVKAEKRVLTIPNPRQSFKSGPTESWANLMESTLFKLIRDYSKATDAISNEIKRLSKLHSPEKSNILIVLQHDREYKAMLLADFIKAHEDEINNFVESENSAIIYTIHPEGSQDKKH